MIPNWMRSKAKPFESLGQFWNSVGSYLKENVKSIVDLKMEVTRVKNSGLNVGWL